ncbi:MAG TPA: TIM-barrel domain-containing protein [Flavobacteriaceae bacterium]|nr:TIM-barrel domain-containing protein [Flavobacteriaceae bacterium]
MKKIIAIFFLFFSHHGFAQNQEREFLKIEKQENAIIVHTDDGKYRFQFYTSEILETSFIPKGEKYTPKSYAVVLQPKDADFIVTKDSAGVYFNSEGIDIAVHKNPFQVRYFYDGKEVISEKRGYFEGEKREKISFNLEAQEILMGGGARALGMDRSGNRLKLYNRAHYGYTTHSELMNYSLPIVLSSKKYLLHFDNAPIGYLDLDSQNNNTLTYETISGRKTYQLIVGETWEKIMANYTLLTGRQPLPPRWALGNFSSRFGYHSQEEVMKTIEKFKEDDIPVDAVIIDLYWFGHTIKGTVGNLEFVRDSFPKPKKMIADLKKMGVKTILVTEPFILTTSKKWDEAVEEKILATDFLGKPFTYDFYFGHTGLIDIFKPKAQEWFWKIYKDLAEIGVAGVWGDLGEPEVHPSALQHVNGSADEVHNMYGHFWAKTVFEGYRKDFPKKRPFILMRAGAAGSQRYGLIPWSGDVSRSWGGLHSQPEIALQMSLQGLAYMHSDLGGFAGDLKDDELYVRWLQYGVFQPIFRPHAQEEVASEPVFKDAKTKALAKKAIELRYRLLPYNYTLAFQNSRTGMPLMRPLFFEEPDNQKLYHIANTYLWGKDFMVSPILRENTFQKEVYFPKTANWYGFFSGKKYVGGTTETIAFQKNHIPVFVRGGAFIPIAKLVQTTENYSVSGMEIHYYFDDEVKKSERLIYNDDGKTFGNYENGRYEILHLKSESTENSLVLRFEKEVGKNFKSRFEDLKIIVHHLRSNPKKVKMNGNEIDFEWNENDKKLEFSIELETEKTKVSFRTK